MCSYLTFIVQAFVSLFDSKQILWTNIFLLIAKFQKIPVSGSRVV